MAKRYVAVDVGGTKILAAVISESGAILSRFKMKTERRSQKKLLAQLNVAIGTVLQQQNLQIADLSGLAIAVPGIVDSETGFVYDVPNAPLSQTPLGDILSKQYGRPVTVGNDVNLGVMGECWLGAARDASSAFGIFVGTGIGGGLVIDGKLIGGYRGLGGEIGHLMVPLGADELTGMLERKHTFLEELCSRTAIENQLRHAILVEGRPSALLDIVTGKKKAKKDEITLQRIRSGALREALKKKDPLVTEVIRNASYLLGLASASVLHVVDPEVIVFGGGVIEACGNWMLPLIEKTIRKVAVPGNGKKLKIVRSVLGDDAIVVGGLALLLSQESKSGSPSFAELPVLPGIEEHHTRPLAQIDKPLAEAG